MAPLPSVSNASYWQYKEDTSYVLKWIEQTAKACGWKRQQTKQTTKAPSSGNLSTQSRAKTSVPTKANAVTKLPTTSGSSGRLKGKNRKAAKQQAAAEAAAANEKRKKDEDERGIVLSALEILEQAQVISTRLTKSDSGAYRPPSSVIQALSRAIMLRQRFSDWFEITRPHDQKSNSAHQYFVKVLEKIAGLFLQAAGNTANNSNEVHTGDATSGESRAGKQNLYESLLEQAVQDESESGSVHATKLPGPPVKEEAATSGQKYYMEVKDSQENALMVFALFIDLHNIKSEIKSLWKRCIKEDADVVITTLLTTQALDFVQRSEERVMSILGESEQRQGLRGNGGPQSYAWSFPGTHCQLLNTLRDPNDIQAVRLFEESSHVVEEGGETVNMNSLTFSFSARRLFYIANAKNCVFADPLLQLFSLDQHALLNADIDKVLDRDKRLCRLLFGLVRLGFTPPGQPREGCPYRTRQNWSVTKDPIITCLIPLWSRHEVNLTSVFAAEVMLDIEEICNAFDASKANYDETFERYMGLLRLTIVDDTAPDGGMFTHTQDSPLVRGAGYEGWFEKAQEILIKEYCLLPVPSDFRRRYAREEAQRQEFDVRCRDSLELYSALGPLSLKHTEEEYRRCGLFDRTRLLPHVDYIFKSFPMFATYREAYLQTLAESVGIDVLNVNKHVIGAMAHLYNASRQLGLGILKWPAMDRLIDLHKVALFAGDLPTTPATMLKSFSHRYWGPKGKMSRKEKTRRMNRAITLMKPSAMTQAFSEHWDTAGRIPFWYTLESNALAAAAAEEKKPGDKKAVFTSPSFLENMSALEDYLTKQLRDVRVDYLEIDRVGVDFNKDLLKHARGMFGKQANRMLPEEADDEWSGIDFVSESFEQEAQLHEAMSKCGSDPSKLPVQDCDYLQDSINYLASALRAKGIGKCPDATDGEAVNMPTSLTRFRIRGSDDLPDMRRLVLVSHCSCCHRKHYF